MESIFFERQEGALCAQHALNALLQGPYFTAVDLATIARTLDAEERAVMGQGGVDNPEFLRAFQQDSHNMDDTGFFSVQVITAALRVWNLHLIPYTANELQAGTARADPTSQSAYICNFREHWFTIRKFASQQWFNLNSVLNGPEPISPTYLHLFLSQLQNDGYSIFIIDGPLPQCQADVDLLLHPPIQPIRGAAGGQQGEEDPELAAALALSLGQPVGQSTSTARRPSTPDAQFKAALAASARELDDNDPSLMEALARSLAEQDDQELKAALLLSMQNGDDTQPSTSRAPSSSTTSKEPSRASTQPSAAPSEAPTAEDLRAKRAAFLDRLQGAKEGGEEKK